MNEMNETAVLNWASQVPVERIPSVIVYLAARLVAEVDGGKSDRDGEDGHPQDKLLKASELAERLNLPESWIRNEERLGHIPGLRLGKYVRFRLDQVEKALAEREQLAPKSRSV